MNVRIALFYALVIECLISVFDLDSWQSASLLLVMATTLAAFAHRNAVTLSPASLVALAYVLGFALPILIPSYYPTIWTRTSAAAIEYGALWAVRGFGGFALGYATVDLLGRPVRRDGWRSAACDESRIAYARFVLTWIGALALVSWLVMAFLFGISLSFIEGETVRVDSASGSLQQVLNLLSSLRYPFLLGFLILRFLRRTNERLVYLFVGLLVVYAIEIVAIGSKGAIIRGIMVLMLAPAFLSMRISRRHLMTAVLALALVYGSFLVITEYRAIMQDELLAGRDVFGLESQAKAFWSALVSSMPFTESSVSRLADVDSSDLLSRFGSGLFSLANLIAFTGQQPPFEHAVESLLVPVYSVVPRVLMPDRPSFFHAGQFAQEYFGWGYGGISVSTIGSFYHAWGYPGIALGMTLLGGLLAFSFKRAMLPHTGSVHWLVLFLVILVPLIDVGTTFQAVITNLIRVAVLLWLLRRLYPKVRRQSPRWAAQGSTPSDPGRHT